MFWGISRGSLEGAGGRVSIFNRVTGLRPAALLTGRLWRGCFPVGFVEFLGAPFLQSTSGRLLLLIPLSYPLLTISPDFLHKIIFLSGLMCLTFFNQNLSQTAVPYLISTCVNHAPFQNFITHLRIISLFSVCLFY